MTAIGIIGGSGLYAMEGFEQTEERVVETPFGAPSDALVGGTIGGRQVWFLPRHGRGHRILPHEINHRANIWALKSLGVRYIICVTAVGSLKEEYAPRNIVLPDQYFDRTGRREHHTFFGKGIAAHIAFGEPVSEGLRNLLYESAKQEGATVHNGGTYVNMDGPAFSTKAESEVNRKLGFDVIGMTNVPEAKLAREAEIALSTLAMVTDYDCWHEEEEAVTVQTVIGHLTANAKLAQKIIQRTVPHIPEDASWPEHSALDTALITPKEYWPEDTAKNLAPIIGRFC
ncbi:methylthioadenosine phosphorylase [Rubritalea squalenifaciens DSM 18772]|uniref:S-methyl-5'-thioadenosine phosphorylase n=1 Tax=Rubritalea squalenifaciens DSM 18772 TaxID=1123071 RepID=A0A1M6SI09_9BACT|nr:S-methyl-5'-thioadenosine phosphorylase [Rubritalea squalenifaciens]SHK44373.1 methylthioadenosine phosphorylase [Rubritalea squalenifaciens DSM 18772]